MSTNSVVKFHTVPFETTLLVRDTCLCLHVQRAARVVARRFDEALKPAGLTNGQFSLLMSLNRPNLPGIPPATIGSVAQLLGMDRTTLTAAIKALTRRGLLEVHPDPADRRIRLLNLTPPGREALAAAMPIWTTTHAAIERDLDSPSNLRTDLNQLAGLPPACASDQPSGPITSASANPS